MRARGYAIWSDPDAPTRELDTCSCGHCGAVIFLKPGTGATTYLIPGLVTDHPAREALGAACRLCMTAVCLACHVDGRCLPLEHRLELSEARDRLRRAVLGG